MRNRSRLKELEEEQQFHDEEETKETNNQEVIISKKLDLVTSGLYKYFHRQLTQEISKENSVTIADYISTQKIEANLADRSRENILTTLISLSKFLRNKLFRDMTKQDIILYLDYLRKPESSDPLHKWIGSYNEKSTSYILARNYKRF